MKYRIIEEIRASGKSFIAQRKRGFFLKWINLRERYGREALPYIEEAQNLIINDKIKCKSIYDQTHPKKVIHKVT